MLRSKMRELSGRYTAHDSNTQERKAPIENGVGGERDQGRTKGDEFLCSQPARHCTLCRARADMMIATSVKDAADSARPVRCDPLQQPVVTLPKGHEHRFLPVCEFHLGI